MKSSINPVRGRLSPKDIDRSGLAPQRHIMPNGKSIYLFADNSSDLVKLDFIFEAGTALQQKKMQSASAIELLSAGTTSHTAREIAEFMDFRGILLDQGNDTVSATLTVYSHSRYLGDLLPLLYEMITQSVFPEEEFDVLIAKRKQSLLTKMQQTSYRARVAYNEAIYGTSHPMGSYAKPEELDLLTVEDVSGFYREFMTLQRMEMVVAGNVDTAALGLIYTLFGRAAMADYSHVVLPQAKNPQKGLLHLEIPGAVQNTLRVGRLLPFAWNDIDYSYFMALVTVLGGYFGSRLMSNIREDKGYTYGVSAKTQVNRGNIMFFVSTDVASDKGDAAMQEIEYEMRRLCEEPIPLEELELVRNCMLGDFMRSIDGIFERSERFCQMMIAGIDERFTDNFMSVLDPESPYAVTPEKLQRLATEIFKPSELLKVSVGQ